MEVDGQLPAEKRRVDFLTEMDLRNCDHVIESILMKCGIVGLHHLSQVSLLWKALVKRFAISKEMSYYDRRVLENFAHSMTSAFQSKETWLE